MLEGTDLYSAYQPLNYEYANYEGDMPLEMNQKSTPLEKIQSQQVVPPKQPPQQAQQPSYESVNFNKQFEQEQRIKQAISQLQRKKEELAVVSQQQSYVDKLFNKKRELGKLLQFVFIIVLGLSIHALIEYYLNNYINDGDLSPWRQFFLRLLYPAAILFVLWNLKVFVK